VDYGQRHGAELAAAKRIAARHGAAMVGYTYDAYTYDDRQLEAWLRELGEILRRRGRR